MEKTERKILKRWREMEIKEKIKYNGFKGFCEIYLLKKSIPKK